MGMLTHAETLGHGVRRPASPRPSQSTVILARNAYRIERSYLKPIVTEPLWKVVRLVCVCWPAWQRSSPRSGASAASAPRASVPTPDISLTVSLNAYPFRHELCALEGP